MASGGAVDFKAAAALGAAGGVGEVTASAAQGHALSCLVFNCAILAAGTNIGIDTRLAIVAIGGAPAIVRQFWQPKADTRRFAIGIDALLAPVGAGASITAAVLAEVFAAGLFVDAHPWLRDTVDQAIAEGDLGAALIRSTVAVFPAIGRAEFSMASGGAVDLKAAAALRAAVGIGEVTAGAAQAHTQTGVVFNGAVLIAGADADADAGLAELTIGAVPAGSLFAGEFLAYAHPRIIGVDTFLAKAGAGAGLGAAVFAELFAVVLLGDALTWDGDARVKAVANHGAITSFVGATVAVFPALAFIEVVVADGIHSRAAALCMVATAING